MELYSVEKVAHESFNAVVNSTCCSARRRNYYIHTLRTILYTDECLFNIILFGYNTMT